MMKTVLSQLTMPYAEALTSGLVDTYKWHQWIWKSFPDTPDAKREFLFRVDTQPGNVRILLLSAHEPKSPDGRVWQSKAIRDEFLMHKAYRFQIKGNPTFRRNADRRRIPLNREEDVINWFQRKLEAIGCRVLSLEVGQLSEQRFQKNGKSGLHISVDASGVLEVADRNAFSYGFSQGIGPAKGFGFGLLMLQPIKL